MQNTNGKLSAKQVGQRSLIMIAISVLAGTLSSYAGLGGSKQILAISIFTLIISATLLFWNFRLAIAFIGMAIILAGNVITLEQFINSAELDIILFLVGMMTLVGVLKDLGLFSWIIQSIIKMKHMTGRIFIVIVMLMSALMACLVDEVTSIVIILALVFQVCDTLKISPTPYVIISVVATNIGSSGTMLGNPIGILIGTKAGFSFIDFMVTAFPIMLASLAVALFFVLLWYRKDIEQFTERLQARRRMLLGLGPLLKIPFRKGLIILVSAISLIALHHFLEQKLGVAKNTLLIVAPLAISGILMIWKNERARHYIESEVEWWTLLFFMMLFAVAGSLERTGVTQQVAHNFMNTFGENPVVLTPVVLFITAVGSAFVDNIVFVAAFIPVVKEIGETALWWALMFGGCFGGNITLIGSTANIVALGMIEKRYHKHITFFEWFKFGSLIGLITCIIACGFILATIIFT
ncbi:MAG TPA: SLC13 family permease [Tenuifilaceae bacterium]|nr:SLC13 family permease [Tenuifilaceae bacterium]HPE18784.1 SLC13 family permease [Tenuifilaceae bacterium]HPJ46058.1 SLC13 family permease [Tenuifilaceae bacterium]HPQ34244.1 SLC13 family permease [Tenuifilaceae bacterium]HRX69213.1 SLC13 family permease [Tenuifilaceae bacterium]